VRSFGLEGHPLHWDDDGPEAGGRKPLATSVLYLAGATEVAAPTVVLNTTATGSGFYVGDAAWVVHAAEGRVAHIPGGMLHGVLPSAGSLSVPEDAAQPARLSLNVAWWPHECRQSRPSSASGKLPPSDPAWRASATSDLDARAMAPRPVTDIFCSRDSCRAPRAEL